MQRKIMAGILLAAGLLAGAGSLAHAGDHALGAGANYWHSLDDIKDNPEFDRDGFSMYLAYQYRWPLLFIEAQVERLPDGFMGAPEEVYAPQAYLGARLLFVYAAAGAGMLYSDGEWADDPFYAFRAGLDLTLLPMVHLDLNVNYRFTDWDAVENDETDIDTDTINFGVAGRLVF